jgi:hypothetical protein
MQDCSKSLSYSDLEVFVVMQKSLFNVICLRMFILIFYIVISTYSIRPNDNSQLTIELEKKSDVKF